MASLDYFDPNEEQTPPVPAGGEAAAPAGPVSLANPQAGTAGGAPDMPAPTPLGTPSGNPAQNGTGFVSIDRYFAPNEGTAASQTASFLGSRNADSTSQALGDGGVAGALQKEGGPTYSAGMGGLDAYLMGRSGLEGGLRGLQDYFSPDPPTPRDPQGPRKPIYDPEIDEKPALDRGGYRGGY